ncbi:MAG: Flp pilus assembly complex ATPase component TadA [Candidatus Omnitrophica bacterium]|nr:Flp pilus assembly complex ATPase component TadA [Candidatus Omnitrophota bacterium]
MPSLLQTLIQEGLITPEQAQDVRDKQLGAKRPFGELLVEMGFIKEELLATVFASKFHLPLYNPKDIPDRAALKLLSFDFAKKYGVFPLRQEKGTLILAVSDPSDVMAIDDISAITGLNVNRVLATRAQVTILQMEGYQLDDTVYDLLKNVTSPNMIQLLKEEGNQTRAIDIKSDEENNSPVINLLALILGDAVRMRATDIHIEPREGCVDIRYRIDGYLKSVLKVPSNFMARLSSRIKVLADLDIAETRKTQDGRVKIRINQRDIDLRLAVIPTFYGEKIAIRLLDKEQAKTTLDKIGFEEYELNKFRTALASPQGMVLVTGPTGSGKTSTLYAALTAIKNETKQIITIEDPIEYLIDGINQIQLNINKDVTFASSLRSILRQDPNVIFVGEIRDRETSDIAFRASQTGHLVLSSLHTNNSVASITRLFDIGVEPYLVSSSLIIVVAQRLVRLICPKCKEEYVPNADHLELLRPFIGEIPLSKLYRGKGCQYCGFDGFYGRTAVFEIMEVNSEIRELIGRQASEKEIYKEARKNGLRTLAESAAIKVVQGLTTIEEITRVVDIARADQEQDQFQGNQEVLQIPIPTPIPAPVPPPTAILPDSAAKLLIVDDEESILTILDMRLRSVGYQVVKAQNGEEALKQVAKEKPDLIIMDVNMPVMNGLEATRALRSKLATAAIPIIMLTALKEKNDELAGLDAGADDYITKPYDKDKLLARIKMLLARSKRAQ